MGPFGAHTPQADATIQAVFERFDANRSGRLDYRELRNCLHALGIDANRREAAEVLARYDADLSGLMEIDEFVRLAHSLGYTGGGAPALPPAPGAGGGWGDEGTRRAGKLVVLLGGVSDLPAGAGAAYAVLQVGI